MQDELAIPDEAVKAPVRAAQYVRMSTDQQKYSTQNQAEAIAAFAAGRGLTVVRTYADEGRSGLDIDRREALQNLIDDVRTGRADFKFILVYDVSRWGRFQDGSGVTTPFLRSSPPRLSRERRRSFASGGNNFRMKGFWSASRPTTRKRTSHKGNCRRQRRHAQCRNLSAKVRFSHGSLQSDWISARAAPSLRRDGSPGSF
jgi:Resolvase, N terminal domain